MSRIFPSCWVNLFQKLYTLLKRIITSSVNATQNSLKLCHVYFLFQFMFLYIKEIHKVYELLSCLFPVPCSWISRRHKKSPDSCPLMIGWSFNSDSWMEEEILGVKPRIVQGVMSLLWPRDRLGIPMSGWAVWIQRNLPGVAALIGNQIYSLYSNIAHF